MISPTGNREIEDSHQFLRRGMDDIGGCPRFLRSRGLTLVEILLSVAILSCGVVLVMQALVRGAYALARAEHQLQAYTFARAKMADIDMAVKQGIEPKIKGEFRMGSMPYQWRLETSVLEDEPTLQLMTLWVGWRQGGYDYASTVSAVTRLPASAQP